MRKKYKGQTIFITLQNYSTSTCTRAHTPFTIGCLIYWDVVDGLPYGMHFVSFRAIHVRFCAFIHDTGNKWRGKERVYH